MAVKLNKTGHIQYTEEAWMYYNAETESSLGPLCSNETPFPVVAPVRRTLSTRGARRKPQMIASSL